MRFSSVFKSFTILALSVGMLGVEGASAAVPLPMSRIYAVASKGTNKALKTLRTLDRRQLDITDREGNTAVCQAIINHDYKAFNVLKQAGANLKARCVQEMPPEEIEAFSRDYAAWARSMRVSGSYFSGAMETESGLPIGTIINVGVGAAVIGGGIALLAHNGSGSSSSSGGSGGDGGGSGGGDSGGGDSGGGDSGGGSDDGSKGFGNTIELGSDAASYRTAEYDKGNFLSQIGAEYAYSRGFGGYEVNDDGSAGDKVKVGVLDCGVDINNPDLAASIITNADGKRYGYNFDYGPCRNGDTTHCYGYKEEGTIDGISYGSLVFYKSGADDYDDLSSLGNLYQSQYESIFSGYASNYDWDKLKNDPAPHGIDPEETAVDEYLNVSENDHGTHVAGIIGANMNGIGMHGVAPYATIIPGIYDPLTLGYGFEKAMQTYAAEGTRVINMSFGSPASSGTVNSVSGDAKNYFSDKYINGYKVAAQHNMVLVVAAGNDGNGYAASYDNGVPLTSTFGKGSAYDMTDLFITVVSADKNNKLASYSQTCGAAQGYCLTAPGGDMSRIEPVLREKYSAGEITYAEYISGIKDWGIYSTAQVDKDHTLGGDGTSYGYMQGTSMATPVVTGAVATLMSAYPHLTSQQVVEILFRTANKDLDGWTDDGTWTYTNADGSEHTLRTSSLYGHGMVDLNAATQPLGSLEIPVGSSTSGAGVALTGTGLALPVNVTDQKILFSGNVMALDDYKRGFAVPVSSLVRNTHRNPDSFKHSFRSFMAKKNRTAGLDDKLSFSFSEGSVTDDNLMGMGAIDMRLQLSNRNAMTFSYRSDVLAQENHIDQALANPFMDMRESYGLTHTFNMNKTLSFSFGAKTGKNGFYEGDEDLGEEYNRSMQAFTSEVAYKPFNKLTLRAVGGMVHEKDSILGLNGSGAFDTDSSKTYFTGAVIEYVPVKPLMLSAAYYYGRSEMPQADGIVSFSDIVSDSFALDARYRFDEKRMLGLQFASPLRVRQGTASFDLPVARDMYTDTVYRDQIDVSLKPTAREYDLGLYYMQETDNYDWRGELMARFHPDHIAEAKPDYRALFGLSLKY